MTTVELLIAVSLVSAPPSPDQMAVRIDRLVNEGLQEQNVEPAPLCSDEDFLRRVTLDLTAQLPSPTDITRFGLNGSDNKRAAVVDRLVKSEPASERWARYWRDTIFSRATNQRARLAQPAFEQWIAGEFESGTGWDEIVMEMITATGEVTENGATGLIFAHDGDANELAAETSRLFTGIQMSCANCHDHPSDQWKRTQFHELAAYFPRVRVRQDIQQGQRPRFYVESQDRARPDNPELIARLTMRADINRDGKITKQEADRSPQLANRFGTILTFADADEDGALSFAELKNAPRPMQRNRDIEHYMADLNQPNEKGELMRPVFFVNGDREPTGMRDMDRRTALARSLTGGDNEWFAKAVVNRYWHELLGEAFYMPVDDLGPGRAAMMPEVLDLLAGGFRRSDYDLQWLVATITRTEAYQRSLAEPAAIDMTAGSSSLAATRLDADQLYGALTQALNVSELAISGSQQRGPRQIMAFGRFVFSDIFGEDPSTPKLDLVGSIPQALALMNGAFIEQSVAANGRTRLADLLRKYEANDDVTIELYLAVLGREPNDSELATVKSYVDESATRSDGFEDVYWALINSAEFLNRR